MNNSNLKNDLQKLQNEFYNNSNKNLFFKNKQKLNCATNISSQCDLNTLCSNTFIIIPNSNKIFMDYTVFKLYANPSNYNDIINYLYKLIQYCIDQYGSYEVHVNLDTFSVSSCHRYKDILKMYCDVCLNNSTEFNVKLIKVYLYNIPNVFESISQILNPFIDKIVISKMVKFNKIDTKQILDSNNNSLIEYIIKLN
jgi:hypothetical protein